MTDTVTFELPPAIEEKLRAAGDLSGPVKEAFALELYRNGSLTHQELSQLLGIDRIATSELLQRHRIYRGSLTMDDLEADSQTLNRLMKKDHRLKMGRI